MMIVRQTLFFSRTVRKRLIHGTAIFNVLKEDKKEPLKKTKFSPERLLELSSIKPFLNEHKTYILQEYCNIKKESKGIYSFVIDEWVAKDIVNHITASNKRKTGIIVEGNPGLGLITLNLINSGCSHILVFDNSNLQDVALTQLISSQPEKITKKSTNIMTSMEAVLLGTLDIGREYGAPVTIIAVTTSFFFIKGLIGTFNKFQLWPNEFEVFLVLSTDVWNGIKQHSMIFKYHMYCMLHLYFTAEEVAKYPRDAFLPLSDNNEDMHLIRFSLNPKAFDVIKREDLKAYISFLRVLSSCAGNFVIPVLEKWLPNCGLLLISKGISMTTQVSDLSYKEVILLFNFLKECEGYSDFKCTLLNN